MIVSLTGPLLHKYVPPPVAISVELFPVQIGEVPVMETVGTGFTLMVIVSTIEQVPSVTVTEYIFGVVSVPVFIEEVVCPVFSHK